MECKFIQHGIAISYDNVIKPCCAWKSSPDWKKNNQYTNINIESWHQNKEVIDQYNLLTQNIWPTGCVECKKVESQGRFDSIRGNGNNGYKHYDNDDITLEIRPGNTCNFACQTCWPEASSRVAQYQHRAGLIDIKNLSNTRIENFDFLLPVTNRIKDVVLLGGEPFYDKSCLNFLKWAEEHLTANIMMFTNGSAIDFDFLNNYPGKLTVIFSLDAIGRPAEYIRYGTEWNTVLDNYKKVKLLFNVSVRVNITCSVYNYIHIKELINFLCEDWPDVVTFGAPNQEYLLESVIPVPMRADIIASLNSAVDTITNTEIESGQKSNAINAITSFISNLKTQEWNHSDYKYFCDFVKKMDTVKNIRHGDYCNFLSQLLQQQIT